MMIAIFWYSPIPSYLSKSRDGQPAFFLEGETFEDLAWDLVEQFFDGFMTQDHLKGLVADGVESSAGLLMDASEFDASMSRVQRYHEERFSDRWWAKKQWMLMDLFCGRIMADATMRNFSSHFRADTILAIHLATMIGRYYAKHHGYPEAPVDPKSAIEYFEHHDYLKWLPEDGRERARVLAGDLSPLW